MAYKRYLSQVKDSITFLSLFSFKKAINYFLLVLSYYKSKKNRQVWHKGLPFSISIEPTTSCNLRCPECPSGLRSFTRPTGMLQRELFKKLINDLHPTLSYLLFYFQGEPYLHPEFLSLVKLAVSKNIYTATSTNGHYLNDDNAKKTVESGLHRLIISVDGTSQDTYESYRIGGNLEKVLEGARNIVKWKKKLNSSTPYLIFQFLVVKPNEHQIPQINHLARAIGIDEVKIKTAQIYEYENGSELIPDNSAYSRYQKLENGKYGIKNNLENSCWKMWHSCVITWDGKVLPCCFDKDGEYVLGNANSHSFKEIWQGVPYNSFRGSLLNSRKDIEICKNCTEGTTVWA